MRAQSRLTLVLKPSASGQHGLATDPKRSRGRLGDVALGELPLLQPAVSAEALFESLCADGRCDHLTLDDRAHLLAALEVLLYGPRGRTPWCLRMEGLGTGSRKASRVDTLS